VISNSHEDSFYASDSTMYERMAPMYLSSNLNDKKGIKYTKFLQTDIAPKV